MAMNLSTLSFRCGLVAAMTVAAWTGYWVASVDGLPGGRPAMDSAPAKAATRILVEDAAVLPPDLAELAKQFDEEKLRAHQAWAAIRDLPVEEIRKVLLPLVKDANSSLDRFHGMMLFRWAQLDPRAAMDYAENFPGLLDFNPNRATVFTAWWTRDPAGAYQWALSDPAAKQERLAWVVAVLRKEAGEMQLQRAKEQGRDALEAMAADLVLSASDQAALDRLLASADSAEIKAALGNAILAKDLKISPPAEAEDDPFAESPERSQAGSLHDALAKLDAANLSPEDADRILNQKLPEWSRTRGREVMTWLVSREGLSGNDRQRDCLNQWFCGHPDEAAEWLLSQGNEGNLYEGVASTARRVKAAFEVGAVRGFGGERGYESELAAVLTKWATFDPAAVERWKQGRQSDDLRVSGGVQTERFNFEGEGY